MNQTEGLIVAHERQNFLLSLSTIRVAKWLRFSFMTLLLLLHGRTAGQVVSNRQPSSLATFLSFATNFPAVCDLVLEVSYGDPSPPKIYEFRYQQNAFLGCELLLPEPSDRALSLEDRMCGCWNDDYWYYEPSGPQPSLSEYRYSKTDTNARAYHAVRDFKKTLGRFQSFGYSDGINTLIWGDKHFAFEGGDDGFGRGTITIRPSDDAPQFAHATLAVRGNPPASVDAQLHYDTNVAPAGIPVEIRVMNLTMRVIRFRLSNPESLLGREYFFPEVIFGTTNIPRIAHVKGQDFISLNGRQLPMRPALPAKRPAAFILLVLLFSLLLVPLLLKLRKQNKQQNTEDREKGKRS